MTATLGALPAAATAPLPTATVTAPVAVHAGVDRKQVTIGDPIRYTVQVSAAPDTEVVVPVLSGRLGDFNITDFGTLPTRTANGRSLVTRWYTLTIFHPGDHLVPAPRVQYRTAGQGLQDATGNEVLVGVTSLLAQDRHAADVRDIKPPETLPFDWRPYAIAALVVLAAGALCAGAFYLLNRPRRQPSLPPRPAHELALAALNRLRAQRLVDAGKFDEYYVGLSAIVRRYLEDGFGLRAPEMTTEEFFLTVARDGRLATAHRRLLAEFLSQADLVKFARHRPTVEDSEAAYAAARRFIEESRPQPAASAEEQHAAA